MFTPQDAQNIIEDRDIEPHLHEVIESLYIQANQAFEAIWNAENNEVASFTNLLMGGYVSDVVNSFSPTDVILEPNDGDERWEQRERLTSLLKSQVERAVSAIMELDEDEVDDIFDVFENPSKYYVIDLCRLANEAYNRFLSS